MINNFETTISGVWKGDPLVQYYNLYALTDVILTCDVDWAPEFAIEYVAELVTRYNCKMTMFSTHKSQFLTHAPSNIEVSLHPDFTRNNGKTPDDIFGALKEIYPNAVGTRSHRNFFGQNIADSAKKFGLRYDASVFLWNQAFCGAHVDYNKMIRFSYMWEDGIHLDMNMQLNWSQINMSTPGLKIINVHPILIYLNSITEEHRRSVTKRYKDLTIAKKRDIDLEVNKDFGIKDMWEQLLSYISENKIRTHRLDELTYSML